MTVISGPLGACKTTLINRLLTAPGDRRIAVIVNDIGEVNIDAELIESENEADGVVDLSNGCICCRLQGDLIDQARQLAADREFDYLVVEASRERRTLSDITSTSYVMRGLWMSFGSRKDVAERQSTTTQIQSSFRIRYQKNSLPKLRQ